MSEGIGDALGSALKKGGWPALILILFVALAAMNAYLVVQVTADGFTGSDAKAMEDRLDARIDGASAQVDSAHARVERLEASIERERAASEGRHQQLQTRIEAIEVGLTQASQDRRELLVQITSMGRDLSQLVQRAQEDREESAEFRKILQDLAERIVKIESWRDGPYDGGD